MHRDSQLTRRTMLQGTGVATLGLLGRRPSAAQVATHSASPPATPIARVPLWQIAWERGLVYGASASTWQLADQEYAQLVAHEAAILFTEDDLLWWRLRPEPGAPLDFQYGDQFVAFAQQHDKLVFGAHLVWDEGFGEGWTDVDIWGMDEATARGLMLDTIKAEVARYQGQVAGWVVVNEAIDAREADGLRTNVPWYQSLGPGYVAEAFAAARAADPNTLLVLNEFGLETDNEDDTAAGKRARTLLVIDQLLEVGAPVQALGLEAHLEAENFSAMFDGDAYLEFLAAVVDRGLVVLVTELDVLDDGLPADPAARDEAIAEVYRRYLDVTLQEPAVGSVMTFGLADRYTWLQEDYPRQDGAARRPLPFAEDLQPKPAYFALQSALANAPRRDPIWQLPPQATRRESPSSE